MAVNSAEYEYKIEHKYGSSPSGAAGVTGCFRDPQVAGSTYRNARKDIESSGAGGTVGLYRRKLGPWEVVEKAEIPGKEL